MSIVVRCKCGKRFRVADDKLGKRGRCPHCKVVLAIPASLTAGGAAFRDDAISSVGNTWHLETEDGQQFGPVGRQELDQWCAEGLITARCFVWQDGDAEMRYATVLYPSLESDQTLEPSNLGESTDAGEECPNTLPTPLSIYSHTQGTSIHSGPRHRLHKKARAESNFRTQSPVAWRVIMTVGGGVCGCIIGYFAAHYFAFFGGIALLGRPHSPARDSLVPGHMLLLGLLLGAAGFGLGYYLDKYCRPR